MVCIETVWPSVMLVFGRDFSLVTLLLAWAVIGFMIGLAGGRHHGWVAYTFATCVLAYRGHLPRDLMSFLDDAHRLGLLRAVGPVYQFRHAELQEHLAATFERRHQATSPMQLTAHT